MVALLKVDNHNFLYDKSGSMANVSVANVNEDTRCVVAYIIHIVKSIMKKRLFKFYYVGYDFSSSNPWFIRIHTADRPHWD